jgi:hypothetical protein
MEMGKRLVSGRALGWAILAFVPLVIQAQPDEAKLSLRTANGQTTFHIGERIPIRLTFSSPNDWGFQFLPLIRGRGDEFDCNQFEVVPATGWSDPMAMYFKQDFIRNIHGWSLQPMLKSKPVTAVLDLNQWVRFDQAGDYTVKVTSHCISNGNVPGSYSLSENIELHIIPATPEWQEKEITSIKYNLDLHFDPETESEDGETYVSQSVRRIPAHAIAWARLQYLATPAAIDELTSRLTGENYNDDEICSIGLESLPDALRETAVASMNKRILDPYFPISKRFFSTLSFLHVTPGSDKESIRKQREAIKPVIWLKIFTAAKKKEINAQAQTVQTLLYYGSYLQNPLVKAKMRILSKEYAGLIDPAKH